MLGGNLPGTREAMTQALREFAAEGVWDIRTSRIMSSPAVDCVPGTPDFLDMAFTGVWEKSAAELLLLCLEIEKAAGRPENHSSRESRILDCDIIFFGDLAIVTPGLVIPHPRARGRSFVLEPLAEIAPDWRFPDGVTVKEALSMLLEKEQPVNLTEEIL